MLTPSWRENHQGILNICIQSRTQSLRRREASISEGLHRGTSLRRAQAISPAWRFRDRVFATRNACCGNPIEVSLLLHSLHTRVVSFASLFFVARRQAL